MSLQSVPHWGVRGAPQGGGLQHRAGEPPEGGAGAGAGVCVGHKAGAAHPTGRPVRPLSLKPLRHPHYSQGTGLKLTQRNANNVSF